MSEKQKKSSEGWKIIIACMLIQAIPYGVVANLQPQFMHYVISALGFSIAGFSLIFTLGTIVSAVASPFIGNLFKKFKIKHLYIAGSIIALGSFIGFSVCTKLWQFYLLAGIMQVGAAIISAIGVPLLINAWFDEASRGKSLGIAFAGGSIGNIFLQSGVVYVIQRFGYASSYVIFGVFGLIVAIPIILFMIRLPKDDSEIVRSKGISEEHAKKTAGWGYSVNQVTKMPLFWTFAAGFFFVGVYVSAMAVQYPTFLHENKSINVGLVGSVFAIASLLGSVIGGGLFDKLGATKTLVIAGIMVFIADIALMNALKITSLAYVFAILKGLSIFSYMMGPALLVGLLFGNKEYAGILGLVQLVFGIGFALGSYVFGIMVDARGYTFAWYVILVAIVLAYIALLYSSSALTKLRQKHHDDLDRTA